MPMMYPHSMPRRLHLEAFLRAAQASWTYNVRRAPGWKTFHCQYAVHLLFVRYWHRRLKISELQRSLNQTPYPGNTLQLYEQVNIVSMILITLKV